MDNLPFYVPFIFILNTFLAVILFYNAANKSKLVLAFLLLWMLIAAAISFSGFLRVTHTTPPRFAVIILPPLLSVITIFNTAKGNAFINSLNIKTLTLLHSVRILVEIVLFWLFLHKAMPQLMTFEGRNFDIVSGLSAPVIYYGFIKNKISTKALLLWNIVCLLILAVAVTNAILSAPSVFQQFAFDQPTVAILYFPFVWLPAVVVPLVYFSHLVAIKRLLKSLKVKTTTTTVVA